MHSKLHGLFSRSNIGFMVPPHLRISHDCIDLSIGVLRGSVLISCVSLVLVYYEIDWRTRYTW